MEGRQQGGSQLARADVGDTGVVAAFGDAVGGEVFQGREDRVAVTEPPTLEAADHGLAHRRDEEWVFAVRLLDARPARLAGEVEDGAVADVPAARPRLG